jgi:hypothetical protein
MTSSWVGDVEAARRLTTSLPHMTLAHHLFYLVAAGTA